MSGWPCETCLENQVTASARGRCSGACVDHLLDGQIDWGEKAKHQSICTEQ